jgi:hypothetical protein
MLIFFWPKSRTYVHKIANSKYGGRSKSLNHTFLTTLEGTGIRRTTPQKQAKTMFFALTQTPWGR